MLGDAAARALARHLQPRLLPQTMRAIGAHNMAAAGEKHLDASITVTRVLRRELVHNAEGRCIALGQTRLVVERGARDRQQRACPPYRDATCVHVGDLSTALRRAYHFFAATSRMTSISRSRSAKSFFSLAFSC